MEEVMADLLTEEQGNTIIDLLEQIANSLSDIKTNTDESDKSLDAIRTSLTDIEINTRE